MMPMSATIAALASVLLVGPPKLPPIGGRSVPPSESPGPTAPAPAPTSGASGGAAKPPAAAKSRVPPPPPAAPEPPPKSPPAAPEPGAPGPELLADGPGGAAITQPRLPGGRPTTTRSSPPVAPAPNPAGALRLVSSDELSQWDRDDVARSKAPVASTAKPAITREPTVVRTAVPAADDGRPRFRRGPNPPERSAAFVLGYRYFRIQDALARPQDWHLASIEVTPLRRYVRLNLITEFGIEGGEAAASGDRADILLMERLGLGMQYPHFVTPFLEFQGGVGGARVELFGRNDIALLYTLGLDAGAQWAVGRVLFLHAAVGWIRPTFVWQGRTASYDRVALKVGFGF